MPRLFLLLTLFASLVCLAPAAQATESIQATSDVPEAAGTLGTDGHTRWRLLMAATQAPAGSTIAAALVADLDDTWHLYWQNPGDAGLPPEVTWTSTATMSDWQWPTPERALYGGLATIGYEHQLILPLTVTLPADGQGSIDITAEVSYLACDPSTCVPGDVELHAAIAIGPLQAHAAHSALISRGHERLPQPADAAGWELQTAIVDQSVQVTMNRLVAHAATPTEPETGFLWLPESEGLIDPAATQTWRATQNGFRTELPLTSAAPSQSKAIPGIVLAHFDSETLGLIEHTPTTHGLKDATNENAAPTKATVAPASQPVFGQGEIETISWPVAIFFAFLGGLILNLMPCVLPVLSLKVLHLVEVAGNRRSALTAAAAFTGGVLVSFWVLGGGLLILQVFFDGIGWGFQLQQPAVLVALSALFVLVAINLFGVFEIGTSLTTLGGKGGGGGIGSNFLGGILAAVAASPCTAPFMGVALGALLLAPAWVAMLGFTALGLGMATPFVLLVISPAAQKLLPKPGMWMERFKQVLGFPLLITAVYLIWVYGRRVDQTGMAWLLVGLIIVSIGAWIYGAWGQLGRRWAQALALAAIAGGIALPLAMLPAEDASAPAFNVTGKHHGAIPWEPLEANTVASFQQQQQAYFIDFTADWCITCQANTARFNTEAVAAQLAELNIKPLIADWTKPSDFIAAALAKRGRRSIPVYVLWKPGWTSEQLLPQLLDENTVLEALQQP